jgi:hypothetical protein
MEIEEKRITIENIEEIIEDKLAEGKSLLKPISSAFKNVMSDIFNGYKNNIALEIKDIKEEIHQIDEFLIELLYGNHELTEAEDG